MIYLSFINASKKSFEMNFNTWYDRLEKLGALAAIDELKKMLEKAPTPKNLNEAGEIEHLRGIVNSTT